MSELLSLLCSAVQARSRADIVALLLSGGLDSTSVGLALRKCGKTIRAYTYRLQGYPSRDLKKAIAIANHFDWPLTVIEVPTADVARDFVRLAVEQMREEDAVRGRVPAALPAAADRRDRGVDRLECR
jgi:asparagine synthetase B (glutamine-hydrolysing)